SSFPGWASSAGARCHASGGECSIALSSRPMPNMRKNRGEANGPDSVQGQELGDRVLDLFQLDWLDQHDEPVAGRQLVLDRRLAGAEQDQGDEGMAVLAGLLMHVGERRDGLGPSPSASKITASVGDSLYRSAARSASPT